MSRIGKQPIPIPEKVEVKINGDILIAKGPKGELMRQLPKNIGAKVENGNILIFPDSKVNSTDKKVMALWGLSRALIFNLVKGVKEGYEKKLEIEGVGYRAAIQGNKLVLSLGFSHPVEIEAPKGIEFKVEKNVITVAGIDKQLVGQVAADIRSRRKPEPYKGKGIRYQGEVIKIKAGKKAVSTEL
ncbi:MAG: 50S ribosomal protein L6 [Candidatus Portnoybacteria bacterium CG08_land_8_20_14_0_20_40_83]|uniref:Large ribosomal subunit protein uL6 n=2 Tax=Candidatus Portnoyibacteriota TaxID=1817913 RepID=A0A2M7YNA8_9BACT|nr:MAG: 50S ribosomal protein L6 [Candidatus Portnoybacteria bacterium CG08_land_8_20_14_0_20_40_83]PIY75447.1 MAG: 50S ribosomal protein L6 [Candidatus Portnoybacteria bacterium CG_4_10_14_0_8_um_filter_40_50]PJA64453.1 MAG: 50S ribosomal protein L6 [Candidatus Portnoybacteria bacterium CG_4_9_14_3_um_filter_40_10]